MTAKNRLTFLTFSFIWSGIWLIVNFSGWVNTVGVFHSVDGSLLLPSFWGALFNALLFFGNSEILIIRFLSRQKVGHYLILIAGSFLLIEITDSTLDFYYHDYFYHSTIAFSEILVGNMVIDFFFILIPSFLYRFGSDWFSKTEKPEVPKKEESDVLAVKSGNSVYQIPVDQITHLESDGNYIKYYFEGKSVMTRDSLSSQERVLPESVFVRCHKSFIVSKKHVTQIKYDTLFLGKKEIPIGRSFRENVKDHFRLE
jgi:hypothetical protein